MEGSTAPSMSSPAVDSYSTVTSERSTGPAISHERDFPLEAPTGQKVAMLLAVTLPFAALVIGIVLLWQRGFMGWLYLSMLLVGWALTGMGITIGFHRLLTHRSFDTYRWVRATWMLIGALSVEGSPLVWCAVHRRHHQYSDQQGDPHSPHLAGEGWLGFWRGLWHSHSGWLFTGIWSHPEMQRYIPDLLADPLLVKLDKLYFVWILLSFIIPTAIAWAVTGTLEGAVLGLLWGGFVRVFLTHHVTWSINSICHVMGQREYVSGDHSRNNWVCGILSFGEGWHNNHHAFPTSARHGLRWWQFDTSWLVIRAMQACGLAWNIKLPSSQALSEKRLAK
ncbi:acyl-CoA desaturase [Anatilimnocola sp. NA78]|uniref:acyl-CoA desaturase n=1 Tax=Anatilimnocola sp. NA78 TaxID=3415683 RepID=UPI003CE4FDED